MAAPDPAPVACAARSAANAAGHPAAGRSQGDPATLTLRGAIVAHQAPPGDDRHPEPTPPDPARDKPGGSMSRRRFLGATGAVAGAVGTFELLDMLAVIPQREALAADAAAAAPSDIQFDVG